MKTIIVKTQVEIDDLPEKFNEFTFIEIRASQRITVYKARENSRVEAWGNSSVVARGNSSVEARENSRVVARGNSRVVARENSSVEAWGNSSVVARGNSSVEAWENSNVVARENVGVHLQSDFASVILFMYSVCWVFSKKAKVEKKSDRANVIFVESLEGLDGWLEENAIDQSEKIILYKKVSKDFKTQEGTDNETLWGVGSIVTHKNWNPKNSECGEGKFHACSRPYFCDEFRNNNGDKYIAIEIKKDDLYAWPNPVYPHKIAFREGKVLYECDKFGKEKKP